MKFRVKVTFCMVALISILYSLGCSFMISYSFKNSLNREKVVAQSSYRMILSTLEMVNSTDSWTDYTNFSNVLNQLYSKDSSNWYALSLSSESESIDVQGDTSVEFIDAKTEISEDQNAIFITETKGGAKLMQISGAFLFGEETLYLDVAYDVTGVYQNRTQQMKLFRYTFLLIIGLCGIFAYILSYFLTKPLQKLSKATCEFASGNYDYRSKIHTRDEVGAVSADFDNMADKIQENIAELEDFMERQNKFLENFTHELKTPMTAIIGYADLLRSQAVSGEDAIDASNYIFSEGKRLERLSLKLLDIFVLKQKDIELSENSPAEIIRNIVEHLRPQYFAKGIALKTELAEGTVNLESDLFYSLMENIIDNARKSFDNGGTIEISCKMKGDICVIKVQDNGRGISEDALRHLSEAFYRVDKSRSRALGGAGLGLALCKEIVSLHNGTIVFESKENVGTTVTIQIKGGEHV